MKNILTFSMAAILIILLNSCICVKQHCIPGQVPEGLITNPQAHNLQTNYVNKQMQIQSGNAATFKDEKSDFWFSIEKLKQYICYAEEEASKTGKNVSGFRIYMGAYPLNSIIDNSKIGYNTVFIVPTEKKTPEPESKVNAKMLNTSTSDGASESNNNTDINFIRPLDYAGPGNPPKIYGN